MNEGFVSVLRIYAKLFLQKIVLVIALFFSALAIMIVLSHFLDPESQRPIGALSFVQPIYSLFFAIPALVAWLLLRCYRIALILICLTASNIAWNEDYQIMRPHTPGVIEAQKPNLRVVAWNVQGFFFGLSSIIESIHRSEADILLLSEVTLNERQKSVFLKQIAPYRAILSDTGDSAILTRLPVVDSSEVALPSRQTSLVRHNRIEEQSKNKHRTFLHAIIQHGAQQLHVLSIRFIAGRAPSEGLVDSLRWGFYLWQQQDLEVRFFRTYVMQLKGSYIFGGDLNAVPSSRTIKLLSTLGQDTYMAHNNWGSFTFKTKMLPSTKDKDLPVMRLDYIFSSADVNSTGAKRLSNFNNSDHYPVEAEFILQGTTVSQSAKLKDPVAQQSPAHKDGSPSLL